MGGVLGGWLYQYLGAQSMYQSGVFLSLIGTLGFGAMWLLVSRGGYHPQDGHPEEEWNEIELNR
ncbi:hypothetical protein D3C75_1216770 [compost metagenome]